MEISSQEMVVAARGSQDNDLGPTPPPDPLKGIAW